MHVRLLNCLRMLLLVLVVGTCQLEHLLVWLAQRPTCILLVYQCGLGANEVEVVFVYKLGMSILGLVQNQGIYKYLESCCDLCCLGASCVGILGMLSTVLHRRPQRVPDLQFLYLILGIGVRASSSNVSSTRSLHTQSFLLISTAILVMH